MGEEIEGEKKGKGERGMEKEVNGRRKGRGEKGKRIERRRR